MFCTHSICKEDAITTSTCRDGTHLPLWFTDPRCNFDYESDLSEDIPIHEMNRRNRDDNSSESELSDCYIEDDYIPQLQLNAFKNRELPTGYIVTLIQPETVRDEVRDKELTRTLVQSREDEEEKVKRRITMARKFRSPRMGHEKRLEIKAKIRIRGLSERKAPFSPSIRGSTTTCTCTCPCLYCDRNVRKYNRAAEGTDRLFSGSFKGEVVAGTSDLSSSGFAEIIYKILENVADNNFKAKDIGMRAQKKLLSRMANKNIAKVFIDDTSGSLLDNLYKLVKNQSNNKKQAEKIVKNIIKIVIKIGILYRNDQFNQEELNIAENFKRKFHSTAMTVTSFYEVEFSFDRNFLNQSINECSVLLKWLVKRHLTEKSIGRIDFIFGFFGNPSFLEDVFRHDSQHKELMGKIVSDIHKSMESGAL